MTIRKEAMEWAGPLLFRSDAISRGARLYIDALVQEIDAIEKHVQNCPVGYVQYEDEPTLLIRGRTTTPEDIVTWLQKLQHLTSKDRQEAFLKSQEPAQDGPYRSTGSVRSDVVREAMRIRDSLRRHPPFYTVTSEIPCSEDIADALDACILELTKAPSPTGASRPTDVG